MKKRIVITAYDKPIAFGKRGKDVTLPHGRVAHISGPTGLVRIKPRESQTFELISNKPAPPDILSGQFLYDAVTGKRQHEMLLTSRPFNSAKIEIDGQIARGSTMISLCIGYNGNHPGDNPFNEPWHQVDVREVIQQTKIHKVIDYIHDKGAAVNGVVFLDDNKNLGLNNRLSVIDALGNSGIAMKVDISWIALEGDEDHFKGNEQTGEITKDWLHPLGRALASIIDVPILGHFRSDRYTPWAPDVETDFKHEWLSESLSWMDGVALQSKKPISEIESFCTSVRRQLNAVDSDLLLYPGESDKDLTNQEKKAYALEMIGPDKCSGDVSFDGLIL